VLVLVNDASAEFMQRVGATTSGLSVEALCPKSVATSLGVRDLGLQVSMEAARFQAVALTGYRRVFQPKINAYVLFRGHGFKAESLRRKGRALRFCG
jgi:hypothetical protein